MAEVAEEVVGIVRAGGGFRVVLDAEERERLVAQAFERLVVEVDVGELDLVGVDGVGIDGEVVVVGGDFDFAGGVVANGMVAAVMAELELVGFAAEGESAELVAQADAEDGHAAHHVADGADGVVDGLGVAGAVGEEDAVGLEGEDVSGGGFGGDDGDAAVFAAKHAQDVLLYAEVVGDNVERRFDLVVRRQERVAGLEARVGLVEVIGRLGGDDLGEVGAVHLADGAGAGNEGLRIRNVGRHDAAHHAVGAKVADQGAGIDLGEDGNGVALHVLIGDLLGAPVGADGGELADDEAFNVRPGSLVIGAVGAVIADLGIGEDDDLAGVGGVGSDFLVTGKGSIKNNLALAFAGVSVALALKDAPVFERKECLH